MEPGRLRIAGTLRPRGAASVRGRTAGLLVREDRLSRVSNSTVRYDGIGSRFMFRINGRPILAKGVNWIPDDVSAGPDDPGALRGPAASGGGRQRQFDPRLGRRDLRERRFLRRVRRAGTARVAGLPVRLRGLPGGGTAVTGKCWPRRGTTSRGLPAHPSLVLWNGNNENLWLHEASRWADMEGGQLTWGERYYLEDLPAIVADVDPSRPYSAGSPWSGSWEHPPNDPITRRSTPGTFGIGRTTCTTASSAPRFVSEFGWQAPPAWRRCATRSADEPITPNSPGVLHHQKARTATGSWHAVSPHHFPDPPT